MPLYEYVCGKCKEVTEVIQSFKEGPLKICPHCGAKKLKKLASAPAIQFKGSGWYVTDYGGKSGEKPGSSEKTESKAEGKSESKESKADSKSDDKGSSKKEEKPARKSPKKD